MVTYSLLYQQLNPGVEGEAEQLPDWLCLDRLPLDLHRPLSHTVGLFWHPEDLCTMVINGVTNFCALSCVLPPWRRRPTWWVHSPGQMA